MDNFRYYEIDVNRDDLVSCGSLLELTRRIYEDRDSFSKLEYALEIRGRFNKNILPSLLSRFLSVPEYLTNMKPAENHKKGYIVVIGLHTPTLFDIFHHPLYHYVNSWDLLLSFEVKKFMNMDDFNVFAAILWNMTLQGYPDNFLSSTILPYNNSDYDDDDNDSKDYILSIISRYPSKREGYVTFVNNNFFNRFNFAIRPDFNIVLTEKTDGTKIRCHRIFPRGPKKGQRCSNLAIPSKEYQNLTQRVYENYFFPTQEHIVCDETLFCQDCISNLYVRLMLVDPPQGNDCWNGIRWVDYPKSLKKDDPDFQWFNYCDQYGWIYSCHHLTDELTLHYIIDDYPRALNFREKEMAKRFGLSVPTDEQARALILKLEYDGNFISKIIAMQRRYKEKLYSDLNFVRSQIKGAWDKECLI